jgi:ketosteroid isomerase-like protein
MRGHLVEQETIIRNSFRAWQNRDWQFIESTLADGFTFTSLYDDHLDKRAYKEKCWDALKEIGEFEIVKIIGQGNEAFVRYKGWINGMAVQNTEHFIFDKGKIKEITVFFGRPEDAAQEAEASAE